MSTFQIDKSLECDGLFQYSTDSGVKYLAKLHELAPESGTWTLDFILIDGTPTIREIFSTMATLTELSMKFLDSKNAKKAILFISGDNREEIDQKTRIFTRWFDNWDYNIVPDPEIVIPGKRNGRYTIPTNGIYLTRKGSIPVKVDSKFCSNCGNPNTGSNFCPNCGTNLQGA